MKKLVFSLLFFAIAVSATADPSGIIASASPQQREVVVKKLLEYRHANNLFSYAWIVSDGTGRTLLKLKHSNGTRGDQNIQFGVVCNSTGMAGKDHQYLGHSYHGSVERVQYFTLDCPSNNIGIQFMAKEVWNSIDLTLKVISAAWGTYTW
jgi:hypothetical protein